MYVNTLQHSVNQLAVIIAGGWVVKVSSRRILGHAPSDAEVAESEALVAELMALQRGSSASRLGDAADAAVATVDREGDRQAAENTLAALTDRNRRLTEECAAAKVPSPLSQQPGYAACRLMSIDVYAKPTMMSFTNSWTPFSCVSFADNLHAAAAI